MTSKEKMEKTYEPASIEARWRNTWEAEGCYKAGQHAPGTGEPYCIQIPPPNVTGTLHMGHAFQHTVMDALTRHARMSGRDVLWQPGTDHAGIATQMVVERNLKLAGEPTRAELGREKFLEKVWEWKKFSAGTISEQIRRMGSSVDWSREAFTMNPAYSDAVIEHFVRLHEQGLIYRGKRLVNWDPVLQTAISDLEVVSEEENGKLWHIRYPLTDGLTYTNEKGEVLDYIVVATTRPETLLGDSAVAVHPEDERYKHLVDKEVELPLCKRRIKIIKDDFVEREFGTGVVKITPAHDFNDYQVGQRHKLEQINILDSTGRLLSKATAKEPSDAYWKKLPADTERDYVLSQFDNLQLDLIPEKYQGLDRFVARKQIVADLEAAGLLEKIDDHKLKVPRGDRSGAVLEPYLTDQWFVDLTSETRRDGQPGKGGLAAITQPALAAVADGRIGFVPDNWKNTYNQWLNNIQDWCISRQLWWGHRIPAWYDADGKVYVGRSEDEVRAKHPHLQKAGGLNPTLQQDNDVFDTWFSSDIWPMATLGWPQQTAELAKYYPSSVLVTGFDIIFFWVARMVMMGQHFMQDVPFKEVYITGLVRDPEGNKMSKSKGNVLDPLDVVDGIALEDLVRKRTTGLMKPETAPKIENKTRKDYPKGIAPVGVDALRFTFAALATQGRDVRFDAGRAEGYRNFCNKIWNASRFVLMNLGAIDGETGAALTPPSLDGEVVLSSADRWIISKLQRLEAEAAQHFASYRFDLLSTALYQFIWNEYCDWYLELSKPALLNGTPEEQRGTRRTLVRVLEVWLRLLHPLMPFVTEEIWQKVAPLAGKQPVEGKFFTLMTQPYPIAVPERIDEAAEADIEWLKGFILGVRQIRAQMDISPGKVLPLLIQNAGAADAARIASMAGSISFLARVEAPKVLAASDEAPESSTALLGEMKLLVPMAGLIDKDAELARLAKQIAKLESDLTLNRGKLENPNFGKAPPVVQQKTHDLIAQQARDLAALQLQSKKIEAL